MKVIVMDVQKGITNEALYNYGHFLDNTGIVIAAARENGIEVIYVQHDDGPGSGFTKGGRSIRNRRAVRAPWGRRSVYQASWKLLR